ncbi:MAG: tail fiber domain-containing protein [Ferruginibacter sp.]
MKYLIIIMAITVTCFKLAAQNVGIGTTTPTRAMLEVNGMVGNTTAIFGSAGNGVGLIANSPIVDLNGYYNGGHRYLNNGYMVNTYLDASTGIMGFNAFSSGVAGALATGVRPGLTIAANGRVRIGDDPGIGFNAQLTVGKDADKNCSGWFAASQPTAFNYTSAEHTYIRSGANLTNLFLNYDAQNSKIVLGGGTSNVGINWSLPVYPLEIHSPDFGIGLMRLGSLNHWLITINFNYLKLMFRSTTDNNALTQLGVFDFTTGQYSASSDRRIKKQIEPMPSVLEKLMQLNAYRYEMKYNNPNHDQTFGFIAQDVKELFPTLVHVTKDANTGYDGISDVHTVAYSGFAPIVIKALQEQQGQLLQMEEKIKQLEAIYK